MAKYYDQVQNELSLSYLYVSVSVSVVVSRKSRVLPSHYQSKDDNKTVIDSLEQFVALYVRSNPAFPSTENEVPSPPVNCPLMMFANLPLAQVLYRMQRLYLPRVDRILWRHLDVLKVAQYAFIFIT